jgi:Methyltransferase domain
VQAEADPDLGWVRTLAAVPLPAAERAIEGAREEHRLFSHLVREHAREGREAYGEIDAPLELYALARLLRPRHVVEVGVSSGISSAYLLRALDRNGSGTLHSVDLPSHPRRRAGTAQNPRASWSLPAGRSSGWAVPFPLRKRWDLRLGDKAEVLPLLAEELPRIDLFVYDVPHDDAAALREFRRLDPRLPIGAVAIADHGPGGGLCPSLRRWARDRGTVPTGRAGTGLFGMRCRLGSRGGLPPPAREASRPLLGREPPARTFFRV